MPTPLKNFEITDIAAIQSTTLSNLQPYQLQATLDALERFNWNRGSNSDTSGQPTIGTILTALGASDNP